MGCPDYDIEKKGGGSALIKNPELAKEIIKATKKGAGKIPVSVKTRIGYNKNEIAKWIPAVLEEKPAVLTVHFRTRNELYSPSAHWELAKEIVKLRDKYSPETLILGNGDVKSFKEAKELVKKYKLDGVMVGRNLIGNPWFFAGKEPLITERLDAILRHAKLFDKEKHWESIKKHFHAYAKGFVGAREVREKLMKVKNYSETKKVIKEFLDTQ
jgi:tRNA-dihydrouridine synthase